MFFEEDALVQALPLLLGHNPLVACSLRKGTY